MNLLISDFYRIIKDKVLYVLLGVLTVLSLLTCIVFHLLDRDSTTVVASVIIQCLGMNIIGTIIGIAIAFFCGKDYEHNTIRNKICCGEGRYKIYFTKLIESLVVATIFFAFTMLCCTIFGAFFFKFEMIDEFWEKIVCEWLLILGFTAIVNCFCVATKSSKATIIFTVVQLVVFSALSQLLPRLGDSFTVVAICRSLYFTVSSMMLDAASGVYTVTIFSGGRPMQGVESTIQTIEYAGMYLNAVLAAVIYILLAIGIALLIVRKQEYK